MRLLAGLVAVTAALVTGAGLLWILSRQPTTAGGVPAACYAAWATSPAVPAPAAAPAG